MLANDDKKKMRSFGHINKYGRTPTLRPDPRQNLASHLVRGQPHHISETSYRFLQMLADPSAEQGLVELAGGGEQGDFLSILFDDQPACRRGEQ